MSEKKDQICMNLADHKWEPANLGLIHPFMSRDTYVPVDYCINCGLLKLEMDKKGNPIKMKMK